MKIVFIEKEKKKVSNYVICKVYKEMSGTFRNSIDS